MDPTSPQGHDDPPEHGEFVDVDAPTLPRAHSDDVLGSSHRKRPSVGALTDDLEGAATVIRSKSADRDDSDLAVSPGSSRSVHPPDSRSSILPAARHQTPAALTQDLQGQRLNHFELLDQIGGGGMGAVFRARDERLGRMVAVKVVPFAAGDPDLQRRFRNEAQSAAKLDHPLIARVFEVGNDGPWYYIVFEYIDGTNIRDLVSRDGPLSLDDAVFYCSQVAEAIGHASRRGIVHRDIKPSNVIVTEGGSIKLVDMGLARSDNFDTSEDMTASGVTLGTFDYISPEQAHDPRLADIRSDLYSLGCTFFYMLTGSPPYPGGTMLQKLLSHGNAAIPDICDFREDASQDLSAILRKMLAKQPEDRYQTSAALSADLRELALREELPRSQGIQSIPVTDPGTTRRLLSKHLPWATAAAFLVGGGVWMESQARQDRAEFSEQLAATLEGTLPNPSSIQIGETDTGTTTPRQPRSADGRESGTTQDNTTTSVTKDRSANQATNASAEQRPNGSMANGAVDSSEAASTPALEEASGLLEDSTDSAEVMSNDPPSLRNFPFPIGSTETDAPGTLAESPMASIEREMTKEPVTPPSVSVSTSESQPTESTLDRGDIGSSDMVKTARASNAQAVATELANDAPVAENSTASVSPNELETPINSIRTIRLVDASMASDPTNKLAASESGTLLSGSLKDAVRQADRYAVDRIEIAVDQIITGPVTLANRDLLITSVAPGGTQIVFQSSRRGDMQPTELFRIGSARVEMVDLHLYWRVPAESINGGCLISLHENRQVRMTDCSLTIDNPLRRDEIYAFDVITDPESSRYRNETPMTSGGTSGDRPTTLPLVAIEMFNVILRGQVTMLRMDLAAELQLLWENGLLAVSRRMIETGGQVREPQPQAGSIRLSLHRLTAYTPAGLLQMRLGPSSPYPVSIVRRAEESVFVVDEGRPHIEIVGVPPEDLQDDWLQIRGSSNAYETDATLNDPLLTVRDRLGQTQVTTMNDIAVDPPSWATDSTPRWVIRWSAPLPGALFASKLTPADFRQDGSLVGGFQERFLPLLPPSPIFDSSPPD